MKNNNYNKTQNSVYRLTYHLVLVVNHRKNIIDNEIAKTILDVIERFNKYYNLEVIEYNYKSDYIYLLFSIHPNSNIQKIVNAMKSATSRIVRKEYPEIKEILYKDSFWTRGYFICTIGDISANIIKEYIKNQGS